MQPGSGGAIFARKKSAERVSPILELAAVRFEFLDFGAQMFDVLTVFFSAPAFGVQTVVLASKLSHLLLQRVVFGTQAVSVQFTG